MAILKHIIPILLASILSTGCSEIFDPQVDTEPVLCINSLIIAGEPIEVEVTHTWMFNDKKSEENHDVIDATVTIFANDRVVASDYLPKEGDKIRIVADSPTYGSATGEVTVPYATPIGNVKVTPIVTDTWKYNDFYDLDMYAGIKFNLNVEVSVNDPAGTDNFYRFGYTNHNDETAEDPDDDTWFSEFPQGFSMGSFDFDAEPIFKEHIGVFESVMGSDLYTYFLYFSDRQFSGKTYTLHLNFSDNTFVVYSQDYDESLLDCYIELYLTTVSQSYYNWAVYKWYVDDGFTGDLSEIGLAESKWGYSNVSTGAGVVAAQSSAKYTIYLKDFLKTTLNNI